MHLVIIDKQDIAALRKFAVTMALAFPVIFMAFLPWLLGFGVPVWPLAVSAGLMLLWAVYPKGIYYPQWCWAWIGFVLGWINTRVLLGLVFYFLIFPMGWAARKLGKLNYRRASDSQTESGWVQRERKIEKQSLERPF